MKNKKPYNNSLQVESTKKYFFHSMKCLIIVLKSCITKKFNRIHYPGLH